MAELKDGTPTLIGGVSTPDVEIPYQGFADRKITDLTEIALHHPELVQKYAAGVFEVVRTGINFSDLEAARIKGNTPDELITNFVLLRVDEIAQNRQAVEAAKVARGLDEAMMIRMYRAAHESGNEELIAQVKEILGDRLTQIHFSTFQKVLEEDVVVETTVTPTHSEIIQQPSRAKRIFTAWMGAVRGDVPFSNAWHETFNTAELEAMLEQESHKV